MAVRPKLLYKSSFCSFTLRTDDGSLFNGLQSIDQWQAYFNHPDPVTLGLMNSAGFLPGFIASFFGDRVAHFFGRRWSVWVGSAVVVRAYRN
jgi:hypothetical protein